MNTETTSLPMREPTKDELVDELQTQLTDSLEHVVHWLTGILTDLRAGSYTPSKAYDDLQGLLYNDGLAYMDILTDLAEMTEVAS